MPEILGKTIKKARESKQLSIEEASEKTRIPKKIIQAIEGDRLSEIPSVFYARGFVRTYSKFLGCENEKAVKDYLAGSEKKKEEPRLLLDNERVPGDWFITHKKNIASVLLVVFCIWILGIGIVQVKRFTRNAAGKYRAYAAGKKEGKKEVKPKKGPSKEIPQKEIPKKEVKEERPLPAVVVEEKKAQGVEIEIVARVNTWMKVVGDGELLFTGTFKKGSSDTWRAKKELNIEFGNAGGVTLKLDGKDIGSPGAKGEKKTIVVTKDGIK